MGKCFFDTLSEDLKKIFPGAKKIGKSWQIPDDAQKPLVSLFMRPKRFGKILNMEGKVKRSCT